MRKVATKIKEKSFVLPSPVEIKIPEDRTRLVRADSAWASKEQSEVDMGDLDTQSFASPVIWTTVNGRPVALDKTSGLEVSPMKTENPIPKETALESETSGNSASIESPPKPSKKEDFSSRKTARSGISESTDQGSGMQNIGYDEPQHEGTAGSYEDVPPLGLYPQRYDPGQWETKNGMPYLLRKGKWERTFPYDPEKRADINPQDTRELKAKQEKTTKHYSKLFKSSKQLKALIKSFKYTPQKGQEQNLLVEKITPTSPNMVAMASSILLEKSDKLIPSELPSGYLTTINGIPWLYDTTTNKPLNPLFNSKDSPHEFGYMMNKPGQGEIPPPTNPYR